ncbi:leucine-rich repeat extensin-like protein 5 isoform X3 [Acyrthosiphon pisum]|uniref:Uncharacterized protein n=1 Tax=Acyrthosiphon pisum TaxID=7029 RepID=A0A8R2B8W0_ACYPI|nr:leucine-rich repeat extensin-like protein 5 isoform X3 [Acyrthosiphon pisum]|eukprot:XP_008186947.1 PREDICTED: leucine-rich repeat extensin-like protein 5 isoform X3 [Acyrthosiphon pisum]
MMADWTYFLAILVSLQVMQDGVHSCTLRSHKVPGPQSPCSNPGAAAPTPAIPRHTPSSCAPPTLGLQYPDALNKIPRPGSDLLNPAVPSNRLLPSLSPAPPAHITTPPPAIAIVPESAMLEAAAATEAADTEAAATESTATALVDEPKSTTVPETAPATLPNSFPASDPTDSVPAAVQTSDPGLANVPVSTPINVSNSTFNTPEASGSELGAITSTVSNTVPAADSTSALTSDAVSSTSSPSDITTPSIV